MLRAQRSGDTTLTAVLTLPTGYGIGGLSLGLASFVSLGDSRCTLPARRTPENMVSYTVMYVPHRASIQRWLSAIGLILFCVLSTPVAVVMHCDGAVHLSHLHRSVGSTARPGRSDPRSVPSRQGCEHVHEDQVAAALAQIQTVLPPPLTLLLSARVGHPVVPPVQRLQSQSIPLDPPPPRA